MFFSSLMFDEMYLEFSNVTRNDRVQQTVVEMTCDTHDSKMGLHLVFM